MQHAIPSPWWPLAFAAWFQGTSGVLELEQGDRVCLIGGALAERLQHDGWFETRLAQRLPELELSLRNLGFGGDELAQRQRTAGFGSPDEWLTRCKAQAIVAFFGNNESHAGAAGLEPFRRELIEFIEHTLAMRYDGGPLRELVLVSPLPYEDRGDELLPAARDENARIRRYRDVMADVAEARGIRFVDLFPPMEAAYAAHAEPLTLNGIHLTEAGNRALAEVLVDALCGAAHAGDARGGSRDDSHVVPLRQAVIEKDRLWFQRYQATDGYNVYGGRSTLAYTDGVSNFDVLQREMAIFDALAEQADRRIWALAKGREPRLDDVAVPAPIAVRTNFAGPNPDGTHAFLDGVAAIDRMTPAPGMRVELFADEARFPELAKPVQMAFDTRGRLWIAAWPTYPHPEPGVPLTDKLLILEDLDGDGRADRCKTFADGLRNPTGFEFWNGGVLVATAPELLFLKDEDGDDRADTCERWLSGLSSADTHHAANSFVLGPDGALYFQEGTFHQSQIETIFGVERNHDACVWRFEPRTWRVERHVAYDFANPHGHLFDRFGQEFVTDGTGNDNYYALPFSGRVVHPDKHASYFPFFRQRSRPCGATAILSSRHFPDANQGNLLLCNVIGFQGIFQYRFDDDGSGFGASEVEPLVQSSDASFRPVDVEVGPDGAVWFLDWCNPIIGHMQHHLRDPNRDHAHGRVYRVCCNGRPLLKPEPIAGRPIAELVALLGSPEDRVRYRARIELSGRPTADVVAGAREWAAGLDRKEPDREQLRLEALWLQQQHGVVDRPLLDALLASPDARVRAAAVHVLRFERRSIPDALGRLGRLARDPAPRVRLETIVAASFFDEPAAVQVALDVLQQPTDRFLDHAAGETLRTLAPVWKRALAAGELPLADRPKAVAFLVERASDDELALLPRIEPVLAAMLVRHGTAAEARRAAAVELAKIRGGSVHQALLAALQQVDGGGGDHARHLAHDLGSLLVEDARRSPATATFDRGALKKLALAAKLPETAAFALAACMTHGGGLEPTWSECATQPRGLLALLAAVEHVDARLAGTAYARVQELTTSGDTTVRGAALRALAAIPGHAEESLAYARRLLREPSMTDSAVALFGAVVETVVEVDRSPARAMSVIVSVRDFAAALTVEARMEPGVVALLDLALAQLERLPESASVREWRRELIAMRGESVLIRTVPHQMLYDRREFTVLAGAPVTLLFQNNDLMPHNLVITAPGMLEEVGTAAEQGALAPDAAARSYVPELASVLWKIGLLLPGASETLRFVAPAQPGDYPYVCTFPGHWRVMNGVMRVVAELPDTVETPATATTDAVAGAEGPPPDEPAPAVRPFVRMWTLDELKPEFVAGWERGRDRARGQAVLREAGCVKCHVFRGEGVRGAPDLGDVAKKYRGADLLKQLLEPSAAILEGYESHTFLLRDGDFVVGRIVEEDASAWRVATNLQQPEKLETVAKDQVESKKKSALSLMPTGLLVTFTREEILDLLAFLQEPAAATPGS